MPLTMYVNRLNNINIYNAFKKLHLAYWATRNWV